MKMPAPFLSHPPVIGSRRRLRAAAAIGVLLCLAGCDSRRTTPEQLSSEFRAIASTASEAELLIEQMQRGRLTSVFARSYAGYFEDRVRHDEQKLRSVDPGPGVKQSLEPLLAECKRQRRLLLDEADHLRNAIDDPKADQPGALNEAKLRFEQIRTAAERATHPL